jgi:hypothetical protein
LAASTTLLGRISGVVLTRTGLSSSPGAQDLEVPWQEAGSRSWDLRSLQVGEPPQLQEVSGALYSEAAAVEDVRVDHGGLGRALSEELLDGADVVAVGEEVGGEGVAQGVAGGVLAQAGLPKHCHGIAPAI